MIQHQGMVRISAAIISYNHERFLGECIESILAQTLQTFEIVICDDHSTDSSWDIIRSYATRYPNLIRAFRNRENNIYRNSYYAMNQTRGDYVSFTDGDDRWRPRKLEMEYRALQANPGAQAAYSNVITMDEYGNRTGIWYDGNGPEPPSGDILKQTFGKEIFPNNASVFRHYTQTRRSIEEDDYIDPIIPIHVDWDLKIRLAYRYKIVYTGAAQVEYRIHDKGMHNQKSSNLCESMMIVYNKNRDLLARLPVEDALHVKNRIETFLNKSDPSKKYELELPDFAHHQSENGRAIIQEAKRIKLPEYIVNPDIDSYFEPAQHKAVYSLI